MATRKGTALMGCLAFTPPALAALGYLTKPTILTDLSRLSGTLLGLFYASILYFVVYRYFTSPLRHLPSPAGSGFFRAHAFDVFKRPIASVPYKWMQETPNDGLIIFHGLLHVGDNLIPTTPDAVMEVLNTRCYDWEKPGPARRFLARILGHGLVNVEGNEHKKQRRDVQPAFSGKVIRNLVPLFWSKALALGNAVQREADGSDGVVEISHLAHRATLDIIGSAGIGKDFGSIDDGDNELAEQYAKIMDPKRGNILLYFTINMIFPQWLVRQIPSEASRRVANAVHQLRRITKELLVEKEQVMREKSIQQKDIIATLMASDKFTDEGLTDQLLTFLAAGHETTASALTWALYLLAREKEVQSRLRKECQVTCGDNLDPAHSITAEIIDSMPYLDAVCSETLRVYPTVPVTSRVAIRQTRIGDSVVPKGASLMIIPWGLNRLPSLWGPDAEEFRPERWLDGSNAKYGGATSPYSFVTFLHGPRSCIGQSFARYELKCLLAVLVMRFELALKWPDVVPQPEGMVTIKPKNGMELVVTPIKH